MYKKDLALNDPQWLICHKTEPTKPNQTQSRYARALENVEYPFIAMAPWSTLARNGGT